MSTAVEKLGKAGLVSKALNNFYERTDGISVISASKANQAGGSTAIATAGNYDCMLVRHQNKTGKPVGRVRPVFLNYRLNSGKEITGYNPLTVKNAISFAGTATDQQQDRTPAFFDGASTAVVAQRGELVADPVEGYLAPGATFYERTGVTVATNGQFYPKSYAAEGGTTGFGKDTGEGLITNTTAEYIWDNASGDITVQAAAGYTASFILGECLDGTIAPSLYIDGDSIPAGGNDDAGYGNMIGGWAARAFANYPHWAGGISGELLRDAVDPKNNYCRFHASRWFTTILSTRLRNDISASRTLLQMQADELKNAKSYMARGQNYIRATALPAPGSTNGCLDLAGQTPDLTATRLDFNAWVLDPGPGGFVAQANAQVAGIVGAGVARVCDPCAGIECNASGTLTVGGGYILPATQTFLNGTASAGTTTTLTDAAQNMTVNAYRGLSLYIVSGTGAGQSRAIGYNTATVLGVAQPFTATPDATSVYRITDANGMNGSHPHTQGHIKAAAAVAPYVDALMALQWA